MLRLRLLPKVDGTDVQEYPIDLVTVSVAQRVSVLVTARNDTSSNWLIHANMVRYRCVPYSLSCLTCLVRAQSPDMFDVVPDDLVLSTSRECPAVVYRILHELYRRTTSSCSDD